MYPSQVHIQSKKLDLSHVTSKCGSLDNIRHRPGRKPVCLGTASRWQRSCCRTFMCQPLVPIVLQRHLLHTCCYCRCTNISYSSLYDWCNSCRTSGQDFSYIVLFSFVESKSKRAFLKPFLHYSHWFPRIIVL